MPPKAPIKPRAWKVADVAKHLQVSPWTVRNLVNRHSIPFFKVGRCLRFRQQAIEAWMAKREH
jgi:excisionase family DNA binding protein